MTVLSILLHHLSNIKRRTIRHVFLYFISFLLVYFSKFIIRFTIISHNLTDEQSRDRTYGGTRGIESLLSAYRYPKATTTAATIQLPWLQYKLNQSQYFSIVLFHMWGRNGQNGGFFADGNGMGKVRPRIDLSYFKPRYVVIDDNPIDR